MSRFKLVRGFRHFLLDRAVLRPSRNPIDHEPQKRIMLDVNGRPLECFVRSNCADNQPPDLLVLKYPGTEGRAERSTQFPMSDLPGVRVQNWTVNPPGYGGSVGRPSLQRSADAGREFARQVIDRVAGDRTTVWLAGNSLGCVTALHTASEIPLDHARTGMLLRNPPPLVPVIKHVAAQVPLGHLMAHVADNICQDMNAMLSAPRVKLSAVFLQSQNDTMVPTLHQDDLIAAYGGPSQTVRMEGLDHSCSPTESHEKLIGQSIEWLWKQTHRAE